MGIDAACFDMIRRYREKDPSGRTCGILGSSAFYFSGMCSPAGFWTVDHSGLHYNEYSPRSMELINKNLVNLKGVVDGDPAPIWFYDGARFTTIETFDINGSPTHKVDLCDPIPEQFHNKYDWIIDVATTPCGIDPATMFKNIIAMVKVGGYVLHLTQTSGYFGRAFYSFSPALLQDVYKCNGFEVQAMGALTKEAPATPISVPEEHRLKYNLNGKPIRLPPHLLGARTWQLMEGTTSTYLQSAGAEEMIFSEKPQPFVPMIPNDSMICCLAKKVEEKEFTKPVPQHFIKTDGR
jgi:hypothetical protein